MIPAWLDTFEAILFFVFVLGLLAPGIEKNSNKYFYRRRLQLKIDQAKWDLTIAEYLAIPDDLRSRYKFSLLTMIHQLELEIKRNL